MSNHGSTGVGTYLAVFAALMLLTAATVWAAFQNFGLFNDVVALGIAATKATLVVLFFMHVKGSSRLTKIAIVASLAFLALLVVFVLADVWMRGTFEAPLRMIT